MKECSGGRGVGGLGRGQEWALFYKSYSYGVATMLQLPGSVTFHLFNDRYFYFWSDMSYRRSELYILHYFRAIFLLFYLFLHNISVFGEKEEILNCQY